jgi:hypothetical protein
MIEDVKARAIPFGRLPLRLRRASVPHVLVMILLPLCACFDGEPPRNVAADEPPRGVIELPTDGAIEPASFRISGWAGDDHGIRAVRVLVDGRLAAMASFVAQRPDVTKVFPRFRHGTDRHGWEALVEIAAPGVHTLQVEAVDTNGMTSDLGSRHVTIAERASR